MFQPAKGTRDFLPDEMRRRNWALDRVRKVFEDYGYEPLGTPAFESWDMLKIKSGDDVVNQIYYFRDKSDRELGLRFEWTASLCRVVASHRELMMPFKRYAIGPVWRYEHPSETRLREFWQADVDIVGVADVVADAEALSVAVDSLSSLGFEGFRIRLNDRRILEALLELTGLPSTRSLEIFRAIDKLNKIGVEGVMEELSAISESAEAFNQLLELTSVRGKPDSVLGEVRETVQKSAVGDSGCNALEEISEYARHFGIDKYLEIDLSLARGLDYYTGPVYEVYAEGYEDVGSIAGGGRYDELIELFGGDPTPATGVALGIERIVPLLNDKGVFEDLALGPKAYVAAASDSMRHKAIEIAQALRQSGISTDMDLLGRSLSKQLDHANRKDVRKVVIVGERELKTGRVTIRDMETAEQRLIEINKIAENL